MEQGFRTLTLRTALYIMAVVKIIQINTIGESNVYIGQRKPPAVAR